MQKKTEITTKNLPIGVFDSGVGGLTIVRELRRQLPQESILYFGDIARLPYGTKSSEQIRKFSEENTAFLESKGIKALVIACNSSSAAAYETLKKQCRFPVLDVITPAVEAAVAKTQNLRIGVLGTHATIESGAYTKALKSKSARIRVFSKACPLFVPLVEEGMVHTRIGADTVNFYLSTLKKEKIDTLVLGCTHYPLLKKVIQRYMGKNVTLIDSAVPCAKKLKTVLASENLLTDRKTQGKLQVHLSDLPRNFISVGEKCLQEKLGKVSVVR